MGFKNDRPFISWKRLKKSFIYASQGIFHTWKHEQNFRVHTLLTFAIIIFAQIFRVPLLEQALLALVIGAVLALELINTAIEHCVDVLFETYDIRAKIIKDAAAGAVFIFSLVAVIVGALIFIPKILQLL
ncbi:diacylglycerol kinase family protein [Evansella sp. AB-rgal1]|uniref:diacylglycerol kinase family protein n=1 Tax=Evansella sp. AB-rgal1 TaxID=3242696 RepID=UPI00359CCFA0